MRRLLIATNNAGKVRELKAIMDGFYDELMSLKDLDLELHTVEDGDTFEANAVKKALEAAEAAGCDALADDSGLCVEALGGAPGVYSARYAGEDATDEENNVKLLAAMAGISDRRAKFVSVVALVSNGVVTTAYGEAHGVVAHEPRGTNGFGYDPLFYVPELGQTFAEIPSERKHAMSHRSRAFAALRDKLSV